MSDETLVLHGARIIDGTGAEPVRGRAVVVEGGTITAVVDEARAPRGRGIDLAGHTLLPGLINCHVHLCFGAEADPVRPMREESLAMTAVKALLRARLTAEAGVTTVRDLGGRDYAEMAVRRAIQEGLVAGPRIVAAGRPVCMTGGHGHFLAREADGPDDARKAVREQLKAGADVIKLIATGGVMTPGVEPGSPQLTRDEMRAAIEEARKAGRRTAAHAMAATGISDAIAAGITSIEHGVFLTDEIVAHMRRDGHPAQPSRLAAARARADGEVRDEPAAGDPLRHHGGRGVPGPGVRHRAHRPRLRGRPRRGGGRSRRAPPGPRGPASGAGGRTVDRG
jgi:imidazolonepropionase-like amidohydrolase